MPDHRLPAGRHQASLQATVTMLILADALLRWSVYDRLRCSCHSLSNADQARYCWDVATTPSAFCLMVPHERIRKLDYTDVIHVWGGYGIEC